MFADKLDERSRDARVLLYLSVRAWVPWHVVAWHDARRVLLGIRHHTPDHATEQEAWEHYLKRLAIDPAYRRTLLPSVRS